MTADAGDRTSAKLQEGVDHSYSGGLSTLAKLGFLGYLIVNRDQTAEIVGLGSSVWWKIGLFVLGLVFFGSFAMSLASVRCYKHTGIVYGEDRKGFALAGGFDVGWWPMLATQTGLYAVYWWTSDRTADPLEAVRNPFLFLAISTLLGLVLTGIAAEIVFPRPRLLRRLRMSARLVSDTRLELSHRTMPLMLLAGVASLGGVVWIYLRDPGWDGWVGIGILLAAGLLLILGASNSYMVFDKRLGVLEARHKYLLRTARLATPLSEISAVAIDRNTIASSLFPIISARVRDKALPLVMVGSFGAAVYQDASRIAQFLDVPLVERNQVVATAPDVSLTGSAEYAAFPADAVASHEKPAGQGLGPFISRNRRVVLVVASIFCVEALMTELGSVLGSPWRGLAMGGVATVVFMADPVARRFARGTPDSAE